MTTTVPETSFRAEPFLFGLGHAHLESHAGQVPFNQTEVKDTIQITRLIQTKRKKSRSNIGVHRRNQSQVEIQAGKYTIHVFPVRSILE